MLLFGDLVLLTNILELFKLINTLAKTYFLLLIKFILILSTSLKALVTYILLTRASY